MVRNYFGYGIDQTNRIQIYFAVEINSNMQVAQDCGGDSIQEFVFMDLYGK